MRNPDCPNCGHILDTFANDFWCSKCREKVPREVALRLVFATKDGAVLLRCKNASLTNKEFCFLDQQWEISNMTMALVHDNGSLAIEFKDGTTREFKLAVDNSTMATAAGLALFGGIGTIIAGNVAIRNQIKARSQQWASAINALISKGRLPEMVYCKYCGTKNKSADPKCIHCGAILE